MFMCYIYIYIERDILGKTNIFIYIYMYVYLVHTYIYIHEDTSPFANNIGQAAFHGCHELSPLGLMRSLLPPPI